MLAVSVDPPEVSEKLRQKLGAGIGFLSDERGVLMDALDVRDRDALPPDLVTGQRSFCDRWPFFITGNSA